MARLIPASERITRARALIQKARRFEPPEDAGWQNFSYVAQIKDLLRQARDLVKFIPNSAGASIEIKDEAAKVIQEADQAEKEILHKS